MGNPTKDKIVNELMRHVLKLEVRGMGAPSHVKWALTEKEFLLELEFMRGEGGWEHKYKYLTMSIWQFNSIGRINERYGVGAEKRYDPIIVMHEIIVILQSRSIKYRAIPRGSWCKINIHSPLRKFP